MNMVNVRAYCIRPILAAGFALALAFMFSCSSSDGSGNGLLGGGDDPEPSSSSSGGTTPSSNSGGNELRIFYGEIGTVCVGYANLFQTPLDDTYFIADGTDNYINMYSICGDKAQSSIYGTISDGNNWLNARNINFNIKDKINQELFIKGNSAFLGFYPAVDGYLRYLYIEEMYDGKGLLKMKLEKQGDAL